MTKPKPKPKAKSKAGRPRVKIDWARVDELLSFGCDGTEIAASMGMHPETLYKACQSAHKMGFAVYSQQKRAKGVQFAREVFYRQAWVDPDTDAKTQTTKQIFWLKNHAGMADKVENKTEHSGEMTMVRKVLEIPDDSTDRNDIQTEPWKANPSSSQ